LTEEQGLAGESAAAMARRLAEDKARSIAGRYPRALIIGSDQTVAADGEVIGKPGDADTARRQLTAASGKWRTFHTALCVLNTATDLTHRETVDYRVKFRTLSEAEIDRYLQTEQPYDCAASMKSEGLGIALLESMEGPDPTALVGLPLIALSGMLRAEGVPVP
jgi:septum formation protein